MSEKIPQKTFMLFNLVDRFINIVYSMDVVEEADAKEFIKSALKEINSTLGTIASEVCIIGESGVEGTESKKEFHSFVRDFDFSIVPKNRRLKYGILPIEKIIEDNTKKDDGKKNGYLRSYFFSHKKPILINEWDNDDQIQTKNIAPGIPEEKRKIDSMYEPFLYDYGSAIIMLPIYRKSFIDRERNANTTVIKSENQLLGYLHIEHKEEKKFDLDPYTIPISKINKIINHVNDGDEWNQYDILFRFTNGISRLISKYVEWDMAKEESKTVIKRFKAYSSAYLNQSGTIFYQNEKKESSDVLETLTGLLKRNKIDFVQHLSFSQLQGFDIESTRFGILLLNKWDCQSSYIAGKLVGNRKPVIILRPNYDIGNKTLLDSLPELPTCIFEYDIKAKKINLVSDKEIETVEFTKSKLFREFKKIVS